MITPPATITLATTQKALYPVDNIVSNSNLQWWAGKTVAIRAFGQISTGTTPGTLTFAVFYGTGADANGVSLVGLPAATLVASITNKSFLFEAVIRCISIGSAGTFFGTGFYTAPDAFTGNNIKLTPANTPAVSAACDLTVPTNILSLQAKRSGSTAETIQVVDLQVLALN